MFNNSEQQGMLNEAWWFDAVVQQLRDRDVEATGTLGSDGRWDADLEIRVNGKRWPFAVEIKAHATAGRIAAIASLGVEAGKPIFLITDHLAAAAFATCRELGVACADLDGNIFLSLPPMLHIEVEGRARSVSKQFAPAPAPRSQLMTRSGVQLLFVLLSDPDAVTLSMRELADASQTALGSVSATFHELAEQNYLSTGVTGGRRLYRLGSLFDRWVEGYRLRLDRKLTIGTYQTDEPRWWTTAEATMCHTGTQWGGETAAWHRDRRLLPAQGVVYADDIPGELLRDYRMRKADPGDGNVVIRRRFWRVPWWENEMTVPSPLIYADLVVSDDPRQAEAAVHLRTHDDLLRRFD